MKHLHIYGAADPGTSSLVGLCQARGIAYTFHDTRTAYNGKFENIVKLMNARLFTIPQVWDETGRHIGGYEAAVAALG